MVPVSETYTQINKAVLAVFIKQSRPSILHTRAVVGWWQSVVCWFDVYSQWPPSPGRCGHELEQWQHQQHCLQQQQQGQPPVCSREAWWLTACRGNHDWSLSCCQQESLSSFLFIILVAEKGSTLQNNRLCTALLGAESMWHWSLVWNNFA